jgi:membrane protease YdiL (CAAX protease family)
MSSITSIARATSPRTAQILFGLVLTLVLGSLPYPVWDDELADVAHMLVNELIYWSLVAATLVYVLKIERLPLASIGLCRPRFLDGLAALAIAVATIGGLAALYFVVFPALQINEDQQISKLVSAPPWWLAISVVRAGASEEILFRGYPIERLQELTGSKAVASILPLIAFTLAHVGPWGWSHVVVAAFGGAMLTLLYMWRRNLWASMVAHCLIDGVAVLAG